MKVLYIALLIFILPFNLFAQRNVINFTLPSDSIFLPLHAGNIWQYMKTTYDSDGPSYSLAYISVENDTLIEDKIYYEMTEFSDLIRYSKFEKKLYIRWQDSDYVHIDFNLPNGTPYQSFWDGQYRTVYAEAGEDSIFNLNRVYGGYFYLPGNWGYRVWYIDSIGLYYDRSADNYLDTRRNIIEAIIYDSSSNTIQFTNHHRPIFEITPLTIVNTPEFNMPFKVKHTYTKIIDPNQPPWHGGVDFIDSVKMFSCYANNDSVINNPIKIPHHGLTPTNSDFLILIELDTSLMKNGYTFNYRFWAMDKGIIPEFSNSPDTGYYQCIWDTTITVIETDVTLLQDFSLSQNFPNPFNPSTVISYQLPISGKVSIKVYDILGREIVTLINEEKPAGNYKVEFDGTALPSGIYFYRLQAGEFVEAKKMILLK